RAAPRPAPDRAGAAEELLERLLGFEPAPLRRPGEVAAALARRARLVRSVVEEVMRDGGPSPLADLYREFDRILFAELSAAEFADVYAQTLTYGLLLARLLDPEAELSPAAPPKALGDRHRLLSSTLRLLGQREVVERIGWSLAALIATASLVDPRFGGREMGEDPALYFYEQFLQEYDRSLRKRMGAYYTPIPVVEFQVRAVQELLAEDLGRPDGLAAPDVTILDPAAGTGTYLLAVHRAVEDRVRRESGGAAVPGALADLAERCFGFDLMVGPYAVARWRLATFLTEHGVDAQPRVILTDTLARATTGPSVPTQFGFMGKPLTEERAEADRVKAGQPIMVILGNPPYQRTNLRAMGVDARSGTGSWHWLWEKVEEFKAGVPAGERVNLKNLAEKYVFFYRWAFWKLLGEDAAGPGRGIVTFISNRSFLDGGAFAGMRAFMREHFQRIVIVDLGGELRAGRLADGDPDENVFPEVGRGIAIAVCVRRGASGTTRVLHKRLRGTAEDKFTALGKLRLGKDFAELPGSGGDPFVPPGRRRFRRWPSLRQVFARSFSGIETNRDDLVMGVRPAAIQARLKALCTKSAAEARELFHETRSRKLPPPEKLVFDHSLVVSYAYRPLDRRFLYADLPFIDWPRRGLQHAWGPSNLALTTLPRKHGSGPAAFVHALLPDRHAYRGSYGGHVFPLWDATKKTGRRRVSNLNPDLLAALERAYGEADPETVFDYVYAVLCAPSYSRRFHDELQQGFPRVPFPESRELFERLARRGEEMVSLHCLERASGRGFDRPRLEGEDARIGKDDPVFDEARSAVRLDEGVFLTNVTRAMWDFEVSGYRVLERWLDARRDLTLAPEEVKELLTVAWALRLTVELGPDLDDALDQLLRASHLDLSGLGPGDPDTGGERTGRRDERKHPIAPREASHGAAGDRGRRSGPVGAGCGGDAPDAVADEAEPTPTPPRAPHRRRVLRMAPVPGQLAIPCTILMTPGDDDA
ncbi:MAG: N-6 DNA methylase, partial [Myxococcota bacterium]|nr:N-6 DNA methylase [Myxococcota bacterium]